MRQPLRPAYPEEAMKILIPVDGSKHSAQALRKAIEIAKVKPSDLYVISVAASIGGMEDHEISPLRRARHTEAVEKLAGDAVDKACAILKEADFPCKLCKTIETSISVPDAIVDFAETENIDLIVIGSKGLSGSSRIKMGSTASQVVKYSPCNVYLVKSPD
jgi:nucleotide-binding universal stress UspA family protein